MDMLIRSEMQLASSCEDKSKNRILLCGWVLFYHRAGDQSSIEKSIPEKSSKLHSLLLYSKAHNFASQTLKSPVAFSIVHFEIKPQIIICKHCFSFICCHASSDNGDHSGQLLPKNLATRRSHCFHWFQNQLQLHHVLPIDSA